MFITADQLREHGACERDIEAFEERWPDGVEITEKVCIEAFRKMGFNADWAAVHLLSPPALAQYEKARAPAWAQYVKARAAAWAQYVKARAPAWAQYVKTRASALAQYRKTAASAFWDALCADEGSAGK